MDFITGFFYEVESKRLLNDRYENIIYKWRDLYEGHFVHEKQEEPTNQLQPNYQFESQSSSELVDEYDENGNFVVPF